MAQMKSSVTLKFDYRWISAVLLLVIIAMLALWRPWEARYDRDARTVTVTGESTVRATPDQYEFYPNYSFRSDDKAIARNQATAKSEELVNKLKELGVSANNIKTNINSYLDYELPQSTGKTVYNLAVEVRVKDEALMQKVLDFIVTTDPEGGVTPQPTFSTEKRKQLETQARQNATREARAKADQSARNLGFRVADVKSVNDGAGFGGVMPMIGMAERNSDDAKQVAQGYAPGENELHYSVTVEYYIK